MTELLKEAQREGERKLGQALRPGLMGLLNLKYRERERERDRERERERQRDRERERQRDREGEEEREKLLAHKWHCVNHICK